MKVIRLRSVWLLFAFLLQAPSARATVSILSASVNGTVSPNPTGTVVSPGALTPVAAVFQDNGQGLSYVFFDFEVWPSPSYACKVGVALGAPLNQSLIYLHDDQGNALPGLQIGTNQSQANSKCQLFAQGSSVTQSGNQYTVTASVIFNAPYIGIKYVYLVAYDSSGPTGWYCPNAAFTVNSPGSANYAPQTVSVQPVGGSSAVGQVQTFQATIRDTNGAFTMWHLEFMLTPDGGAWQPGWAFQPVQRCKVVAEASANLIWVESDTENGLSPPGYANFGAGSPSSISSNRCTLYPSMTSEVYTDIDTAVITFAISFSPNFTGALQDHMYVVDNLGLDHWDSQMDGTWGWSVGGAAAPAPYTASMRNHQVPFDDSNLIYVFNDGVPITITYVSGDGTGDAHNFETNCAVTGSGVSAAISNQSVLSFDITYIASPGSASGQRTVSCVYVGYYLTIYTVAIIVYDAPSSSKSISLLTYDAFIAPGAVSGVSGDVCLRGANNPFQLWYGGDNRSFSFTPPISKGSYRVLQQAYLIPDQNQSYAGAIGQTADTGISRNYPSDAIVYNNGNPIPDPTITDADPVGDCYRLNALAQLNPLSIANTHKGFRSTPHKAGIELSGNAVNPSSQFQLFTPGIVWDLTISEDDSNWPGSVQYLITGSHKCFPNHEITLRGSLVYSFTPSGYDQVTIASCLGGFSAVDLTKSPVSGTLR